MNTKHFKPMVTAMTMTVFLCMMFASCKPNIDDQLNDFEESISFLEKNYRDLTPSELEEKINLSKEQLDSIDNNDMELTPNQTDRLSKLKSSFHKLSCQATLDALERSIDFLEENYETLSGSEKEEAINQCKRQLDNLNYSNDEITQNQKKQRLSLAFRFHKLIINNKSQEAAIVGLYELMTYLGDLIEKWKL